MHETQGDEVHDAATGSAGSGEPPRPWKKARICRQARLSLGFHARRVVMPLVLEDDSEWWDADFPEEHLEKLTASMLSGKERGETVEPAKWGRYYILPYDPISDLCFSHSMAEGRRGRKPPPVLEEGA